MRRTLLLAVIMFFTAERANAFVVEINPGDTESSILQRYPGLSSEKLREANPGINFGRFLIARDPIEIPFVLAHELHAAKARVAELEEQLGLAQTKLGLAESQLAAATAERDALIIERDGLKSIADSVAVYRNRSWWASFALVVLGLVSAVVIRSLHSGIQIEKGERHAANGNVERLRQENLELKRTSSAQPPKRVVVHAVPASTPGKMRTLVSPR